MFTGIIDHTGSIADIEASLNGHRLWIESQFSDLQIGESIAVDGACVTVVAIDTDRFCCEVSTETLCLTRFGAYQAGAVVNLERALRAQDRLGGHFVSGHVDQLAKVQSVEVQQDYVVMRFHGLSEAAPKWLVHKGSVTVNGVSLTLNQVNEGSFEVMIIPHTLKSTNLGALKVSDTVDIEYDLLAKTVANYLQRTISYA